jgi:hypothetical protein
MLDITLRPESQKGIAVYKSGTSWPPKVLTEFNIGPWVTVTFSAIAGIGVDYYLINDKHASFSAWTSAYPDGELGLTSISIGGEFLVTCRRIENGPFSLSAE